MDEKGNGGSSDPRGVMIILLYPYYNGGSKVQVGKTDLETRVCNTGEN